MSFFIFSFIYIYIYIYIYILSSHYADNAEPFDYYLLSICPIPPSVPILHLSWTVLEAAFSVYTVLMFVSPCKSSMSDVPFYVIMEKRRLHIRSYFHSSTQHFVLVLL